MIEARYEDKRGFYFNPDLKRKNIINMMSNLGNTEVNFAALTPCSFGHKNPINANQYVMDRIVAKINNLLKDDDFSVKAIVPIMSSNNTRDDGVVEVEYLIFQIQYI